MPEYQWEQQGQVVHEYQTQYPNPLMMQPGDVLQLGRKDTDWPDWIWCTNMEGKSGWVPERYLDIQDKHGTAKRDYTAAELDAQTGEQLDVFAEEGGWYWCRNRAGVFGWIPVKNVVLLPKNSLSPESSE